LKERGLVAASLVKYLTLKPAWHCRKKWVAFVDVSLDVTFLPKRKIVEWIY
jgi:hypothetical protein